MSDPQCAQIEAMLPWYLNGTAAAEDRTRVETHLAACPNCRQRLAAEERIVAHMRSARSTDTPNEDEAWQRFERTIEAEHTQPPQSSRHLRWIVAAQSAALVIFALTFWQLLTDQRRAAANYRTVTTSGRVAAPGHRLLHLTAAPGLPANRVAAVAREHGGEVVSGPSAQGVYILELVPEALQQQAIARLRAAPGVLLVEPIASSDTR